MPGGSASLKQGEPFADNAFYLFNLAKQALDKGDYFPIWGTCLGFELLNKMASNFTYDL